MNAFSTRALTVLSAAALATATSAQEPAAPPPVRLPQISPSATVTQTIGVTDLTVKYSRPGVKGRAIWGGLVPYDAPWRAGANSPTTLATSQDLLVEGQKLPAGTYSLFTIPGKDEWTVIFNKNAEDGLFADDYDVKTGKDDALRVKVKPRAGAATEWLEYRFDDPAVDSTTLVLAWDKLEVPIALRNATDTKTKVMADLRKSVAEKPDDYTTLMRAANYSASWEVDPDQGLLWADAAIKARDTTGARYSKARLLKQKGRTAEAIAEADKALSVATKETSEDLIATIKRVQGEWKAAK
jgi:hypothetical protein